MTNVQPCPESEQCPYYEIQHFDDGNESLSALPNRWRVIGPVFHEEILLPGKVTIVNEADTTVRRSISFWKITQICAKDRSEYHAAVDSAKRR